MLGASPNPDSRCLEPGGTNGRTFYYQFDFLAIATRFLINLWTLSISQHNNCAKPPTSRNASSRFKANFKSFWVTMLKLKPPHLPFQGNED